MTPPPPRLCDHRRKMSMTLDDLLCERLEVLAEATGAAGTAVADMTGMIFGCDRYPSPAAFDTLGVIMDRCWASLHGHSLGHGRHIKLWHATEAPYFAAVSFAEIYVLVAWWNDPYSPFTLHRLWDEALPEIERFLLALPPLTDGGGSSIARAARRP
jgi:hypothetical protein